MSDYFVVTFTALLLRIGSSPLSQSKGGRGGGTFRKLDVARVASLHLSHQSKDSLREKYHQRKRQILKISILYMICNEYTITDEKKRKASHKKIYVSLHRPILL